VFLQWLNNETFHNAGLRYCANRDSWQVCITSSADSAQWRKHTNFFHVVVYTLCTRLFMLSCHQRCESQADSLFMRATDKRLYLEVLIPFRDRDTRMRINYSSGIVERPLYVRTSVSFVKSHGQLYMFIIITILRIYIASRDSAVGKATGYGLDAWEVGVRVPVGSRIFTSPCRPDRLCGPPNLLYRELFPGGKAAGAWTWPLTSN
jgi:hypothetical protein